MYLLEFLKHRSFKSNKIQIIINLVKLVFLQVFKIKIAYVIKLKKMNFLFNFVPLGKQSGSRGIYIYRENYELLLKNCHTLIKKDDIVLDVGANQGIFTVAFSKLTGPNGKVLSIEPFDKMVKLIKSNILINSLANIKILTTVVSDKEGYESLDFGGGIVSASIVRNFSKNSKIAIKATTIDTITKDFNKINFIKLDIEGAELKALNGAKQTLHNDKPILSIEVDSNSFDEINEFLKPFGYESYIFDHTGKLLPILTVNELHSNMIFISKFNPLN
jgi:FkbM family methyltransferase|tara:strand:- start:278 stop:1102 length:825 start_codon:yes stop_codon:yes gene_type:complete